MAGDLLGGQRLELVAVEREEAAKLRRLATGEAELRLRGLQKVVLHQPLAEQLRTVEEALVLAGEGQHRLEVAGALALGVEQALALAVLVEALVLLVDAEREGLAVVGAGEDERIAAQEGGHVAAGPVALGIDGVVLVGAHSENDRREDILVVTGEDDGVIGGGGDELGGKQRHRVDLFRKRIVAAGLERPVAVPFGRDRHSPLVDHQLFRHVDPSLWVSSPPTPVSVFEGYPDRASEKRKFQSEKRYRNYT